MDCFTVSIASGVILGRWRWRVMGSMALLFGLFQALMPLIGWLGTSAVGSYFAAVDHWVAFGLLAFLGGRMIREAFQPDEEKSFDPALIRTQLVLAVATSIDAAAVGISMSCSGLTTLESMAWPLAVIGFVSLALSLCGSWLGIRFGAAVRKRLRPELLGGAVLIFIGIKVLVSHLAEEAF